MAGGPIASAAEPFIGEIKMFAGNFAPRGYAQCDGQLLQISMYTALFSILGTTYGGDGRTTFQLPDLRGRVPMHRGSGPGLTPRSLGEKSGQEMAVLTSANQLPGHTHPADAYGYSGDGNQEGPGGNVWAKKNRDDDYSSNAPNVLMNAAAIDVLPNATTGQGHYNMQPYQVVNFIIALQGLYPSRN
jgi:microcystin-dependent protein